MAKTIIVSDMSGLLGALAAAKGGETILLQGGNYGELSLIGVKSKFPIVFPDTVTIQSADPGNPAVFTGVDIRDGGNMTFDGILFDYTFELGHQIHRKPFSFSDCSDITIRNSVFDGDLAQGVSEGADGLGWAFGLSMARNTNAVVENNEFFNFYRGLTAGSATNMVVRDNEMHSIRMDGMNFAKADGILIEGNHLHSFTRSPYASDHADMIQFWTNGATEPSRDITIRGNTLDMGAGGSTQSIFMRNDMVDRGLAGQEMFYQNILIENNTIVNGHTHGITVGETDGLIIRNNTVLHPGTGTDGAVYASSSIPRISVASDSINVEITANITSAISGWKGQESWLVKQNAFVQNQDPLAPGFYQDVFITSSLGLQDGGHQVKALPGGMIDKLGAGAEATLNIGGGGQLAAYFQVHTVPGDASARIFDASATLEGLSALPEGTVFEWHFGDGHSAKGLLVSHSFANGGLRDVELIVRMPSGQTATSKAAVGISGPDVLKLGSGGVFTAYALGQESATAPALGAHKDGLLLGTADAARVDYKHMRELFRADSFDVSMTLKAAKDGVVGEIFRMNGSFIVSMEKDGQLRLRIWGTEAGEISLKTSGLRLNDSGSHDILLQRDDGMINIYVNGKLSASAAMPTTLRDSAGSNLAFGSTIATNFEGILSRFEISANAASYDSPETTVLVDIPPVVEPVSPEPVSPEPVSPEPVSLETNPVLLASNFDSGLVNDQLISMGVKTHGKVMLEQTDLGLSLRLASSKSHVEFTLDDNMDGNEAFTLSLAIRRDAGSETQRSTILDLPGTASIRISQDAVRLQGTSSDGESISLIARGVAVANADWHQITYVFSQKEGTALLYFDGVEVARQEGLTGAQYVDPGTSLTLGKAGGQNFVGVIDNLVLLKVAVEPEQVRKGFDMLKQGQSYEFVEPRTMMSSASYSYDPPNLAEDTYVFSADAQDDQLDFLGRFTSDYNHQQEY